MANTLTYLNSERGVANSVKKNFSCLLSGNYTNSGGVGNVGTPGETLSFNTAVVNGKPSRPRIPNVLNGSTSPLPKNTDFEVFLPNGYDGQIEQNATSPTAANYVLRIFTTAGTELGAGAYPAGLTAEAFKIVVRIPLKYD